MSWQEDLQQLDRALAAGQISADDYRLRRDEVLAIAAQALPGAAPQQQQPQQPQGPFPPPFRWGQPDPTEATQVVGPSDSERTQVVRPVTPQPATPQPSPDSERTQFVRPAQPDDGERTQVVQTGTPSGGFPAQIFPQQPPTPPAWQDNNSAPPWGSADGSDGGNVWANVQGPEVFTENDRGGKGKVIALVVVVLLVVGAGAGWYFLWGPGKGESTAGGSTSTSQETSSTKPSPPPVRKTPDGPFVEVEGKASQFKTLDMADALVAKVPTFDEAQLLQQSGVTSVRFAVSQDDGTKLSQGIWAFKSTNPTATLAAIEQLYQAAQFTLLPTSPKGVPIRHLPITATNTTSTYRAHYISTDFVVRVEAYAPDEAAAKLAFDTLLQRQLAKFPATA
jgi:hypothetical protein